MLNKDEKKFLDKIAATPGIAAVDLPRANRGKTIKSLELTGLIHFGPGGWYLTTAGEIALSEDVAAATGGIPAKDEEDDVRYFCKECGVECGSACSQHPTAGVNTYRGR